jgi:hypothetical protein
MPQYIYDLADIAIEKNRGVLAVSVRDDSPLGRKLGKAPKPEENPKRRAFIAMLKARGIGFSLCEFRVNSGFGPYSGTLYIDVPYATEDPDYQLLSAALEHPDGTLKDPHVRFWVLSLSAARAAKEARTESARTGEYCPAETLLSLPFRLLGSVYLGC